MIEPKQCTICDRIAPVYTLIYTDVNHVYRYASMCRTCALRAGMITKMCNKCETVKDIQSFNSKMDDNCIACNFVKPPLLKHTLGYNPELELFIQSENKRRQKKSSGM